MPDRRRFVATALGAGLLPVAGRAQQMGHGSAVHGGHAMPAPSTATPLAAPDALPAGAALRRLRPIANLATRPGEVSVELVAAPVTASLIDGGPTELWAFNGSVPGPLIEANEGDTVIVRFVNRLPQPSTIHWHGLPVPPDQDGNPHAPVPPGGTHVYRFTLPRGCAGTYWYHPHPHGHTAEQAYRGLAGGFIVRAADDPLAGMPERHLMVSDLRLLADGGIPPNGDDDLMDGREGQFVLLNGQREPSIGVTVAERWRVWNACNARYLDLSLAPVAMTQVGSDGGLLAAPVPGLETLLLAPGERAEFVVSPQAAAVTTTLTARAYSRGKMAARARDVPVTLARVAIAAGQAAALPPVLRPVADLGAAARTRTLVLSEAHGPDGAMRFLIDGKTFDMDRIDHEVEAGVVEYWDLRNDADMDHPFHLHGVQFLVVARQWRGSTVAAPYAMWKDTVNLRAGETVRIKTMQPEAGLRLYHCHILEHEDAGMMGQLRVTPRRT